MNKPLHFVVIADVGDFATYHVGDEAMLEANLAQVRQWSPGTTFTVVSHDPAWTSEHYNVRAVPPIGFSNIWGNEEAREALLAQVIGIAEARLQGKMAAEDAPGAGAARALESSDGLIISGGGNLSSSWPGYLYERVALIHLAHLFQKPAVILGQTLGPQLTPLERKRLAEALPLAQLVGVREKPSFALAQSLGVDPQRIAYQLDDAFFLEPQPATDIERLADLAALKHPWIAVTLHSFFDSDERAYLTALAEQLDEIVEATGAPLIFVPHLAGPDREPGTSDVAVGHKLAALLKPATPKICLDVWTAREARWLTGQAAMVISTRYHPLVFAVSAGVPSLGIYVDEYTRVKLQGALAHAGLEAWTMPMELAAAGMLTKGALDLWDRRADIHRHLSQAEAGWRGSYQRHWTRVLAGLRSTSEPIGPVGSQVDEPIAETRDAPEQPAEAGLQPTSGWARVVDMHEARHRAEREALDHWRRTSEEAVRYITSLKFTLDARDEELASIKSILQTREKEIARPRAMATRQTRAPEQTEAAGLTRGPAPASLQVHSEGSSSALAICTIISKNYLAHARVLVESFLEHHPGSQAFVLLVDQIDGYFDPAQEQFVTVKVDELEIANFSWLAFRYSVTELNTAVKPFFLEYLFRKFGIQKLCYFDPDIVIYERLDGLAAMLDTYRILLTPHLIGFLNDEHIPSELNILLAGAYNLGFIGLSRNTELEVFLRWWQRKLLRYGRSDVKQGLFVDQRWIDLAPGLFSQVHIVRDPGYNVAYWNLNHRHVQAGQNGYVVNGASLKFFHFSGFLAGNLQSVSRHQNRFRLEDLGEASELFMDYRERLMRHGFEAVHAWPYAYGVFDDGVPVPDCARWLYHDVDPEGLRWPNPFEVDTADSFRNWVNQPADNAENSIPFVTRLAMEAYRRRSDLQEAFPDVLGQHQIRFAHWFVTDGQAQLGLHEIFISATRQALSTPHLLTARPASGSPSATGARPSRLKWKLLEGLVGLRHSRLGQAVKRVAGQRLVNRLKPRTWDFHRDLWLASNVGRHTAVAPGEADLPSVPAALPSTLSPGLNVVGYIRSESGVGETARSTLRALRRHNYPVAYTSIAGSDLSRQSVPVADSIPEGHPYGMNLFHINADQAPSLPQALGLSFFTGKYNIGYWHWELNKFPEIWRNSFDLFDEIWVGSSFVQSAVAPVSPIPVVRMPPCIEFEPEPGISRRSLGLPEDKFIFAFAFDMLSIAERKNPYGLIEAYRRAFGSNAQETALVVKFNNFRRAIGLEKALGLEEGFQDKLPAALEAVSGIMLDETLGRPAVLALYGLCDCFVSLHRCEGFGIAIAEAMYLGKPCIATAYSANMDFMTPANSYLANFRLVELERDYGPYKTGAIWAEPDIDHAASLMRRVYENRDEARGKGATAATDMRRFYGCQVIGQQMTDRLALISKAQQSR